MGDYVHFSRDPSLWGESIQTMWGSHDICPSLSWFQVKGVTQSELLSLSHAGAWRHTEKPQCNMAYLLIVLGKTINGEMAFRLAMVWAHPHQATLSSLDEVARKLTLLINIGDIWAYTFMQLNEGTLYVPLSNEGHIKTMIDGVPSSKTCGYLCQLEVCKLLQCGDQVVCPEHLNRGLEPLLLPFPKPPVRDMDTLSRPVHKPSPLQMDLPSVRLRDQTPITPAPCGASTPPPSLHSTMECPSETATHPSMATELQELLSQVVLDTSSPASGDSTPRRPVSLAKDAPLTIRMEDPFRPDRPV